MMTTMTMKRTMLAVALVAGAAAAQASTVVAAADSFDATATGWSGNWTTSSASAITNSSLVFSGASSIDNAASRDLSSTISANKVLISFDLQFQAGSVDTNDFLALWLGSSAGPSVGIKGNCGGTVGCDADLLVRGGSSASTTALTVGTSYHLFAVLEKINGASVYNRYSLWVDPTADEMSSLTGADAISNGSTGLASFSTIGFRTANLDANDRIAIDNLNISVVPEPGTFALAGLALAGLALTRRRSKKA